MSWCVWKISVFNIYVFYFNKAYSIYTLFQENYANGIQMIYYYTLSDENSYVNFHIIVFQTWKLHLLLCTFSWNIIRTSCIYAFSKLEDCIYSNALFHEKSYAHLAYTRFPIWKSAFTIMHIFMKNHIRISHIRNFRCG